MSPREHLYWSVTFAVDALLLIGLSTFAAYCCIVTWAHFRAERDSLTSPADIPPTPRPRPLYRLKRRALTPAALPAETVLAPREGE